MKTSRMLLLMLAVLCTIAYFSCKKPGDGPTPKIIPEVVPPYNTLCNGKNENGHNDSILFPLDSLDSWTYDFKKNDTIQPNRKPFVIVIGYAHFNQHRYSILVDTSLLLYPTKHYLRKDSTSKNIYYYDSVALTEYLEVPLTPTLGPPNWTIGAPLSKMPTDTNKALNTGYCSYGHTLEITVFNVTGTSNIVIEKMYYKKGVGLVDVKIPAVTGVGGSPSYEFIANAASFR